MVMWKSGRLYFFSSKFGFETHPGGADEVLHSDWPHPGPFCVCFISCPDGLVSSSPFGLVSPSPFGLVNLIEPFWVGLTLEPFRVGLILPFWVYLIFWVVLSALLGWSILWRPRTCGRWSWHRHSLRLLKLGPP